MTSHMAMVLASGTCITLPSEAWLNQSLVRALLIQAGSKLGPPLDDGTWASLVVRAFDLAESEL